MSTRTSDFQISQAAIRVTRLLKQLGVTADPYVVRGDKAHGVTNKLLINRRDLFTDGTAGFTRTELGHALAVMEQTLRLVVDSQDAPPPPNLITLPVPHLAPAS